MAFRTLAGLVEGFKDSKRVAIIDRRGYRRFSYTYRQLHDLSHRFAAFLDKSGVKKGDRIVVWTHNSIEYAVILLGAFLQGAVVVPIDLRSDVDLVNRIQKQVNAKLIFQTKYRQKPNKLKTVFTEQLLFMLEDIEVRKKPGKVSEHDIAELIYTSGTTGEPKGVILTHKNLVSNISALSRTEKVKICYRFLSVLPLSHVFEQTVGFLAVLSNRASIVYLRTLKTSALFDAFRDEQVTNALVVPRLLELMRSAMLQKARAGRKEKAFLSLLKKAESFPFWMRRLMFRKIHKKFGSRIRFFACGGAPLDKELEQFYSSMGFIILQGYGLTETSPVLTLNTTKERRMGSVGRPLPGVEIKIAKNSEVLAKGDTMTTGYYKNSKKTKALFTNGWLKTGDLGYLDDKGFLYLKGREKDMIVTAAGVNVYPEDIESVLNSLPGVRDSCVIGVETRKGEEIHAVLLLKEKTSAKAIVSKANQQLDDSQNIQHYSVWHYEDFPRTTTMKVKKFVVKQAIQKKAKPVGIVKTENKVHAVVSRLAKKKVAGNATLQSLGLSSVDRIELASLLEQEFSIEIDEEHILPSTKVKDVEKIVKQKKVAESMDIFRRYALHPFVRLIRFILKSFILHPFVRLFSWPSVKGKENLKGLKGPVIFASNHQSHFDTPAIFMKLPFRFSLKIAVAAWQEFFFTHDLKFKGFSFWLRYVLSTVALNLYPLPQSRMARKSMEYTGYLLDKGWSILIFPEGIRSTTGKVSRFMQGIGMLAVEMQVPVVPVRIDGMLKILPRWRYYPTFGRAKLKIGKPIILKRESYLNATEIIEKAVKEL